MWGNFGGNVCEGLLKNLWTDGFRAQIFGKFTDYENFCVFETAQCEQEKWTKIDLEKWTYELLV